MQYRPKLDKFLCYYDLTTGGLVIGCVTFFGSIIFILLDIFCMAIVYLKGCEEFQTHLKIYGWKMSETQYKICEIGISIALVIMTFIASVAVVVLIAALFLIQGSETRDHHKVRPFLTVVIVGAILSLLPLLSFNLTIIIGGIVAEIICLFAFVNVYSLYQLLKEENDKLISVETVERY